MSKLKATRIALLILYVLVIGSPMIAIDWLPVGNVWNLLLKVGKAAGLIAFVILVLQVVLTCRLKMLDRIFAIDNITNFHKIMGMIVACLLIAHVSLIIAGTKNTALLSMETSWRVNLGKAALGLALVTVMLAVGFQAFGLDYNVWRVTHKSALAIVLLGFLHSYFIGYEVQSTNLKTFWWILLFVCVAASSYRNLYIPFLGRKRYSVQSVAPQTHNTYTITLRADKKPIKRHKPGQFMFLKLKRPGRKSEIHPFTIASSPTQDSELQVTIKQSGNFTNTIDQTKSSDKALVEGPYGRFSLLNYPESPLVFIAGGVGITPIMSMIRYLRDTKDRRDVTLLYGNRARRDIIFESELEKLPENFRVTHILSDPDNDWSGPKGYITKDIIADYAQHTLGSAEIFLCGPPPMMKKIIVYLKEMNVAARRIHYERFSI
jgi:predicted ferric reductase